MTKFVPSCKHQQFKVRLILNDYSVNLLLSAFYLLVHCCNNFSTLRFNMLKHLKYHLSSFVKCCFVGSAIVHLVLLGYESRPAGTDTATLSRSSESLSMVHPRNIQPWNCHCMQLYVSTHTITGSQTGLNKMSLWTFMSCMHRVLIIAGSVPERLIKFIVWLHGTVMGV